MGVSNIITFDAHDPRVQNSIPLHGLRHLHADLPVPESACYASHDPDFRIDNDHLMVISPDEGAMGRAVYFANILGVDMGMFYKRRDYSTVVNGTNPIVAHEFLGDSVEGKDVIIIDDMISSGESMLDVAKQLKERKAEPRLRLHHLRSFHRRPGEIRRILRERLDLRSRHHKPSLQTAGASDPSVL